MYVIKFNDGTFLLNIRANGEHVKTVHIKDASKFSIDKLVYIQNNNIVAGDYEIEKIEEVETTAYDFKYINDKATVDNAVKVLENERDKHLARLAECAKESKFVSKEGARSS